MRHQLSFFFLRKQGLCEEWKPRSDKTQSQVVLSSSQPAILQVHRSLFSPAPTFPHTGETLVSLPFQQMLCAEHDIFLCMDSAIPVKFIFLSYLVRVTDSSQIPYKRVLLCNQYSIFRVYSQNTLIFYRRGFFFTDNGLCFFHKKAKHRYLKE